LFQKLRDIQPLFNKRLEAINCEKCLKIELIEFWCHRTGDNFCHTTDSNGMAYYLDSHHVSPLGAMLNADYILRMYKKFMHVRRVNVTELSASEIMNSIDQMQLPLCLKPVCDCLK
jgi:hypothetical protein